MIQESNEQCETRHSHLDVPLLTSEDIEQPIGSYVRVLSEKCEFTELYATESEMVVLVSKMCQMLIGHVSMLVLKSVALQVEAHPHTCVPEVTEGTSADASHLLNSEPSLGGCSYCRVTEDDIKACFGNILDNCFGQLLDVVQRRSCDSVRLHTLLSMEIAKRVNSVLNFTTAASSVQPDEFTSLSVTMEMVHNVINILKTCTETLRPKQVRESLYIADQMLSLPDSEEDDDEDSTESSTWSWSFGEESEENWSSRSTSSGSQITEVKNGDQHSAETSETSQSTTESSESLGFTIICPIDEIFLTLFLQELVSHIAKKTHTSVPNIDFEQLITDVKEWFMEDQSYTLPQSIKQLYKSIYKDLTKIYGSKYVLLDRMVKTDESFVVLVAVTLKSHLKKPTEVRRKPKKVWRIFRKKDKVHPVCENTAAESHSKENDLNGSTPSHQQNRQRSCVTRTFFCMINGLKKAFTCCTC